MHLLCRLHVTQPLVGSRRCGEVGRSVSNLALSCAFSLPTKQFLPPPITKTYTESRHSRRHVKKSRANTSKLLTTIPLHASLISTRCHYLNSLTKCIKLERSKNTSSRHLDQPIRSTSIMHTSCVIHLLTRPPSKEVLISLRSFSDSQKYTPVHKISSQTVTHQTYVSVE